MFVTFKVGYKTLLVDVPDAKLADILKMLATVREVDYNYFDQDFLKEEYPQYAEYGGVCVNETKATDFHPWPTGILNLISEEKYATMRREEKAWDQRKREREEPKSE